MLMQTHNKGVCFCIWDKTSEIIKAEMGKLKDSTKICFLLLFMLLFLREPANNPPIYTCLRRQIVSVFLVRDKEWMISLEKITPRRARWKWLDKAIFRTTSARLINTKTCWLQGLSSLLQPVPGYLRGHIHQTTILNENPRPRAKKRLPPFLSSSVPALSLYL